MSPRNYSIKHEDGLCNQRMTWLITLQSFLFGAYGFSLGSGLTSGKELLEMARNGFFFMGCASSLVIFVALFAAKKSIDRLVDKVIAHPPPGSIEIIFIKGLSIQAGSEPILSVLERLAWDGIRGRVLK